jgi:hypothetical protein
MSKKMNSSGNSHQAILSDPLGWLTSQADALRRICNLMEELAAGPAFGHDAFEAVIAALRYDLPLQLRCEREELFPLLNLRARKDDEVETVLSVLSEDSLPSAVRRLLPVLERARIAGGAKSADASLDIQLKEAAELLRMHLSLGSAVVIPISRLRFAQEDLELLAQSLIRKLDHKL